MLTIHLFYSMYFDHTPFHRQQIFNPNALLHGNSFGPTPSSSNTFFIMTPSSTVMPFDLDPLI